MNARSVPSALAALVLLAACSGGAQPAARASGTPAPAASTPSAPPAAATPTAIPTPPLPAYYIESLRARPYPGGKLEVQDQMFRGAGFTKYHMTWPSSGQTMTGTISLPDGPGPFPVVVVNHGFIPPERYWIGQDSGIFGDPLAAHGFISVAPNWPGYSGSGPAPADLPSIVGQMVASLDLVSALYSLPQADTTRVALIGHSNGGGISEIAMVVDPRVKAVVLFAPVSTDMSDNGRKWWVTRPEGAVVIGTPDANPQGYAHLSPRNYLAAGQPPALFLQGTADQDIPAAWTQASYDAMKAKGIQADLVWFPGAQHDMVGTDLDRANQLSEAWIRKALGI
jgi:uncharacterized protein